MLLCEMLRACKAVASAHCGQLGWLGSPARHVLSIFTANAVLLSPGRNATLLAGHSVPGLRRPAYQT